jgi:hypothetical protein
MPDFVLILSDMQFDQGTTGGSNTTNSVIKKMFKEKGYDVPKLVYWNLNSGYGNFPTANYEKDVALVSGFSPNVMKAVLSAKSFSPVDVMNEAIRKFEEMLNS